jgi:small nuclear ribonucleoprotein (snRNP)-like protein
MEELTEEVKGLTVHEEPEVQWLHSDVLGKDLKLVLRDSREITGKLQCVDHLSNIVLTNAVEFLPSLDLKRTLGNVIVPDKGILNIFLLINNPAE